MVATSNPTLLRRWIGLELRRLRETAATSRPDAAARLGKNRSQLGHYETGRNLPSKTVLEALLDLYGVPDRLADFLDLVSAARKGKDWWDTLGTSTPTWFDLYLGLERGAERMAIFDPLLVPGVFQTSDYARGVISGYPGLSPEEIERRVQLRMARQTILQRDDVQLNVVLDEAVLYRQRGAAETMTAQLAHLLTLSDHPHIQLHVLPRNAGGHPAQQGGFTLLKFPAEWVGDPGLVYVDALVKGQYFEQPDEIAAYERAMQRLLELAATPAESQTIMARAMKETQ